MPYKIDNKFVSKEKYEAHMAAQNEKVEMTEQTPAVDAVAPTRKPRTTSPLSIATAALRKAKADLARVEKLHLTRAALPSLEDAKRLYEEAKAELQKHL